MTDPVGSSAHRQFERDMADLSDQQLAAGLERARTFTGYFSFPAFREMCRSRPSDLGMPEAHAAYLEAARSDGQRDQIRWSHPAVYHAACETGWFELRTMTERECFPLYRRNYEIMIQRVLSGEQLDMPVQKALPEKIPEYVPREESLSRVAALKELLG